MELQIETFEASDCADVIAFWGQQDGIGLSDADEPEQIVAFLARNRGLSFVVRDAGQVVAAVLCGHDGRRGYLHHLAVAPSHRRRGLGTRLVERCIAGLRDAGIGKCNIFLFADNATGQRFWSAAGFNGRPDLLLLQRPVKGS